jgi:XTP/dITP diphosphohydrolase|tara:strand:+ start:508 stop:1113 length:606 start_codon:yes stop_codon:yes gene_type:complete
MQNKKIQKLLIGTNNKGKLKEIRDLLPKNIKTIAVSKFKLKSPKENGKTFEQNSLIKSRFFSKKTNLICLADDSGLEIDLLNNKPGIYSARWGGKSSNFKIAIKKVYRELNKKDKNWKNKKNLKARFVCVLSICYLNKKITIVKGKVEGSISHEPKGKNGFGYDPIFIPFKYKKTFGEMRPKQKYKLDHRFKAFKKIRKFF